MDIVPVPIDGGPYHVGCLGRESHGPLAASFVLERGALLRSVPKVNVWILTQLDERILEYLDSERWSTPTMIAEAREFNASPVRIGERCRMLQYAGMIAPIHNEMYEITTNDQLYLQEEIDTRYRPWPTVDRVLRG